MGFWFVVLYSVPVMGVLWFTEDLMLALGQDPEVARLAGVYMQVMLFSLIPSLMTMALRSFITVLEKANIVLWATLAGAVLNAGFDYALIFGNFGFPRLELVGAGIASVATSTFTLVLLMWWTTRDRVLRRYAVFGRIWRSDWPKLVEIMRLGWPIAVTLLTEVGLFSASSVMMGWIGTVELAAHGIGLQLASISFMVPLGMAQAAMIRIGLAAGRGDREGVGRAGWTALIVATLFMCLCAVAFWVRARALCRALSRPRQSGRGRRAGLRRVVSGGGGAVSGLRRGAGHGRKHVAWPFRHVDADDLRGHGLLGRRLRARLCARLPARLWRHRPVVGTCRRARLRVGADAVALRLARAARPHLIRPRGGGRRTKRPRASMLRGLHQPIADLAALVRRARASAG